jgi:hypothetical protein
MDSTPHSRLTRLWNTGFLITTGWKIAKEIRTHCSESGLSKVCRRLSW